MGRKDGVKVRALCEEREVPLLRIGVTDKESRAVEIIKKAENLKLDDFRTAWADAMPELFV